MGRIVPRHHVGYRRLLPKSTFLGRLTSEKTLLTNFLELRNGEVQSAPSPGPERYLMYAELRTFDAIHKTICCIRPGLCRMLKVNS